MRRLKMAIAVTVLTTTPVGIVVATADSSDARDTTWACPTCYVGR